MLDTNSLLDLLLPEVPGLVCLKIYTTDKHLLLIGACLNPTAACPLCATVSQSVHSYYTRRLSDLPWANCQVSLLLTVRRFYCNNPHCSRQTFTERKGWVQRSYLMLGVPHAKLTNYKLLVSLLAERLPLTMLKRLSSRSAATPS